MGGVVASGAALDEVVVDGVETAGATLGDVVMDGVETSGATLGDVVVDGVETAGATLGVVVDEVVMDGAALVGVVESFEPEVELDGCCVVTNVVFIPVTSEGEEVPSLVYTSVKFEPTAGYLEGGW